MKKTYFGFLHFFIVFFKSKGCRHNGFDGMHSVFCFLKNNRSRAFKYLVCDLHAITSEAFAHFATNAGVHIVKSRKAMHKYRIGCRLCHKCGVYLIGRKVIDALLPNLNGLTHRYPYVGVDDLGILYRLVGVALKPTSSLAKSLSSMRRPVVPAFPSMKIFVISKTPQRTQSARLPNRIRSSPWKFSF